MAPCPTRMSVSQLIASVRDGNAIPAPWLTPEWIPIAKAVLTVWGHPLAIQNDSANALAVSSTTSWLMAEVGVEVFAGEDAPVLRPGYDEPPWRISRDFLNALLSIAENDHSTSYEVSLAAFVARLFDPKASFDVMLKGQSMIWDELQVDIDHRDAASYAAVSSTETSNVGAWVRSVTGPRRIPEARLRELGDGRVNEYYLEFGYESLWSTEQSRELEAALSEAAAWWSWCKNPDSTTPAPFRIRGSYSPAVDKYMRSIIIDRMYKYYTPRTWAGGYSWLNPSVLYPFAVYVREHSSAGTQRYAAALAQLALDHLREGMLQRREYAEMFERSRRTKFTRWLLLLVIPTAAAAGGLMGASGALPYLASTAIGVMTVYGLLRLVTLGRNRARFVVSRYPALRSWLIAVLCGVLVVGGFLAGRLLALGRIEEPGSGHTETLYLVLSVVILWYVMTVSLAFAIRVGARPSTVGALSAFLSPWMAWAPPDYQAQVTDVFRTGTQQMLHSG